MALARPNRRPVPGECSGERLTIRSRPQARNATDVACEGPRSYNAAP